MNYFIYLKKNLDALIFWFTFHGLALFVNVFNIEGILFDKYYDLGYSFFHYHKQINLFTTAPVGDNSTSSSFWPINLFAIKFQNDSKLETKFPGIFFEYDISEFIAYSFIIFLVSYIFYKIDDGFPIQMVLGFLLLLFITCFSLINIFRYFL